MRKRWWLVGSRRRWCDLVCDLVHRSLLPDSMFCYLAHRSVSLGSSVGCVVFHTIGYMYICVKCDVADEVDGRSRNFSYGGVEVGSFYLGSY